MADPNLEVVVSAQDRITLMPTELERKLEGLVPAAAKVSHETKELEHPGVWQRLSEHAENVRGKFGELAEKVAGVGERIVDLLPMLAGLGSVGSIGGLAEMARQAAELGEHLHNLSVETGVTTQALQALVAALVYAQTDWSNASAATTARSQLFDLIDAQAVAAADAGQDALYAAWQGVSALMMQDFIQRAQALPDLGPYATQSSLPALALAQRLYADASQADRLVALNAALHPLFMPLAGMALAS